MSLDDYSLNGEIAASHAGDLVGWRAEVAARLQDFLARKAVPATEKVGALVRAIEGVASRAVLKSTLSDLLYNLKEHLWREKGRKPEDAAEKLLLLRILEYRRSESIENYGAYLFTVDVTL